MTNPKTPWDLDVRVRERNLKKGVLDEKEVQTYLKDLPDLSANAEIVTLPQPAIAGSAAAAPAAIAPVATPAPSSSAS
jgi:hypothetical protein